MRPAGLFHGRDRSLKLAEQLLKDERSGGGIGVNDRDDEGAFRYGRGTHGIRADIPGSIDGGNRFDQLREVFRFHREFFREAAPVDAVGDEGSVAVSQLSGGKGSICGIRFIGRRYQRDDSRRFSHMGGIELRKQRFGEIGPGIGQECIGITDYRGVDFEIPAVGVQLLLIGRPFF